MKKKIVKVSPVPGSAKFSNGNGSAKKTKELTLKDVNAFDESRDSNELAKMTYVNSYEDFDVEDGVETEAIQEDNAFVSSTYHDLARSRDALTDLAKQMHNENKLAYSNQDKPSHIHFMINYHTTFGQEMRILGSCEQLGSWDSRKAQRMYWTEGNNWMFEVIAKQPLPFEYKYILTDLSGNVIRWEGGNNRYFTPRDDGAYDFRDHWQS